mgnify:CR=1 FL=1
MTQIPYYKVRHVIHEGQFEYIKQWIKNPDKPALLINYFGTFEINLNVVLKELKTKYLPRLRENPANPYAKETFSFLWSLKNKILPFIKNKKKNKHGKPTPPTD